MEMGERARVAPMVVVRDLQVGDLGLALSAGWRDFRARPAFGLFFSGIYVIGGWAIYLALFTQGKIAWLVPAAGCFPIIAPFIAVGLYDVSRGASRDCRSRGGACWARCAGAGTNSC